jgi:hypothetical protein
MTDRNRENGQKGGGRHEKQSRYDILDQLARQRFKRLAFVSDKGGVIEARKMAAEYDAGAEDPVFRHKGRDLSRAWYEEWLTHYRSIARGDE